jgi:hypothetical protein
MIKSEHTPSGWVSTSPDPFEIPTLRYALLTMAEQLPTYIVRTRRYSLVGEEDIESKLGPGIHALRDSGKWPIIL